MVGWFSCGSLLVARVRVNRRFNIVRFRVSVSSAAVKHNSESCSDSSGDVSGPVKLRSTDQLTGRVSGQISGQLSLRFDVRVW
ncbi:hypothetical protein Hanom_Chr13g01201981 [Helianthus anomalus]